MCLKKKPPKLNLLSIYDPGFSAKSKKMILVFKTTVGSGAKAKKLKPYLDKILPDTQWNFDLTDCDKILRVVSPEDISTLVISTLNTHGFECVALE